VEGMVCRDKKNPRVKHIHTFDNSAFPNKPVPLAKNNRMFLYWVFEIISSRATTSTTTPATRGVLISRLVPFLTKKIRNKVVKALLIYTYNAQLPLFPAVNPAEYKKNGTCVKMGIF